MSCQALRVLPLQVSRVSQDQERHVLPSAREILCPRLPSLVQHPVVQQVQSGEDALETDDGEGGAGAHASRPELMNYHCQLRQQRL